MNVHQFDWFERDQPVQTNHIIRYGSCVDVLTVEDHNVLSNVFPRHTSIGEIVDQCNCRVLTKINDRIKADLDRGVDDVVCREAEVAQDVKLVDTVFEILNTVVARAQGEREHIGALTTEQEIVALSSPDRV